MIENNPPAMRYNWNLSKKTDNLNHTRIGVGCKANIADNTPYTYFIATHTQNIFCSIFIHRIRQTVFDVQTKTHIFIRSTHTTFDFYVSIFIHSLWHVVLHGYHTYNNQPYTTKNKVLLFPSLLRGFFFFFYIFLFYKSLKRGRKSSQFVQPVRLESRTYHGDHIIQPVIRRTKLTRSEVKILTLCLQDTKVPIVTFDTGFSTVFFTSSPSSSSL